MEQVQPYISPDIVNSLITKGDISGLTPQQKNEYYKWYCERLGLDPASKPFMILKLQGKETLYLDRSGAQQLNALHNVSHQITSRELIPDAGVYQVTARASKPEGRFTESIGAVNIQGLKGDAYANAIMKAETKAKRRATLDLLGLGILDETEVETIPNAKLLELNGENVSISNQPEPAKVIELSEKFYACKTIDEIKDLWATLDDQQKKDYFTLKEQVKLTIYQQNPEAAVKSLRTNNWETLGRVIEEIIDKEQDAIRKSELIGLYEKKLHSLKIDHQYTRI